VAGELLVHRREDLSLVAVVVVERSLRDACPLGHVLDADVRVALLGEQLCRRVDDGSAGLLGAFSLATRHEATLVGARVVYTDRRFVT
jgi:hypothetical protein